MSRFEALRIPRRPCQQGDVRIMFPSVRRGGLERAPQNDRLTHPADPPKVTTAPTARGPRLKGRV